MSTNKLNNWTVVVVNQTHLKLKRVTDTDIHCLVMLAKFHGVAAEAEQLQHQFGRADAALDDTAMLRAAKSLKLKTRKSR